MPDDSNPIPPEQDPDLAEERAAAAEPNASDQGTKQRKWTCSLRISLAVMAVHERKALGWEVDYRAVAERYNTTPKSLKAYYYKWRKGDVKLCIAQTPEEKLVDRRLMYEKMSSLVDRHTALILTQYEGSLYLAEDKTGRDSRKTPKNKGQRGGINFEKANGDLSYLRNEIDKLLKLRTAVDQGFDAFIEDERGRRTGEKPVTPTLPAKADDPPPVNPPTHVIHGSDVQRALEALRNRPKAPVVDVPMEKVDGPK